MSRLYTLGESGFPPRHVLDALGASPYQHQATTLIAAPSMAAAARELERVGFGSLQTIARMGLSRTDAPISTVLGDHGLFREVTVVVLPIVLTAAARVVVVPERGRTRLIGHLTRSIFTPVEEVLA